MKLWQVTYFNTGLSRQCVLIDEIDEETADAVVAKFGNEGDEFCQLPQVQKEMQQ